MATYRLSNSADQDFDSLYVYGVLTFGLEQADSYAAGMLEHFTRIAEQPRLYQAIDPIRPGMRRSVYGAHEQMGSGLAFQQVVVNRAPRQDLCAGS